MKHIDKLWVLSSHSWDATYVTHTKQRFDTSTGSPAATAQPTRKMLSRGFYLDQFFHSLGDLIRSQLLEKTDVWRDRTGLGDDQLNCATHERVSVHSLEDS